MTGIELTDGRHYGVGTTGLGTDHTLLVISTVYDTGVTEEEKTVYVCIDCGLVSGDKRLFHVEECNRKDNPIPKSLREQIRDGEGLDG